MLKGIVFYIKNTRELRKNLKTYKVYNSMSMLRRIIFSYNYQICKVIMCQFYRRIDLLENQDLHEWSLKTQNNSF